ncbi:DUF2382 domain-containing protein [Cellulomonas endophytica]|uniref:DUF2382 domain-containing protein n=1 Tax=Cellulomonas endophytica TaxID=2494735 RepID=UPI0010114977|nr:PRC and DUF2382 domain-containing protein [Cellulomonas endophytica]
MITTQQAQTLAGTTVHGSDGAKIGKVGQVYLDDASGSVEWVTVHTGLFGTKEHFVPVADATTSGDGLSVPFTADQVKNAPSIDAEGHLDPQEEEALYRHYSLDYATTGTTGTAGTAGYADTDTRGTAGYADTDARGTVGHDTSGPTTDDAMTLSEERLDVGTERREAGRARLRKYVVTEQQTVQVPVSREEVRLEREPITDANRGAALSGPDLSSEEHEVILTEERPVIATETVPVERVRLDKETVTDTETVTAQTRHEEVELDDAGTTTRGTTAGTDRDRDVL